MKKLDEFKDYFEKEFVKNTSRYNKKLQTATKIANVFRLATVCFSVLFASVIVVLALKDMNSIIYVCVAGIVIFCIMLAFSYYDFYVKEDVKERFENKDKEILIREILEKGFEYKIKGVVQPEYIKNCGELPEFDRVDGEDLFCIDLQYEKVTAKLQCSDIELKKTNKDKGFLEEEKVYSGFFGYAELSKTTGVEIEINIAPKSKAFEEYKSESELFNDNFSVYVKNEKKTDKILSAGLMLALLNLQNEIRCKFKIKIHNSEIYMFAEKDLFTLDLQSAVEFESVKGLYTELSSLVGIVTEIMKTKCS